MTKHIATIQKNFKLKIFMNYPKFGILVKVTIIFQLEKLCIAILSSLLCTLFLWCWSEVAHLKKCVKNAMRVDIYYKKKKL